MPHPLFETPAITDALGNAVMTIVCAALPPLLGGAALVAALVWGRRQRRPTTKS